MRLGYSSYLDVDGRALRSLLCWAVRRPLHTVAASAGVTFRRQPLLISTSFCPGLRQVWEVVESPQASRHNNIARME
jgi:hypothetical protein